MGTGIVAILLHDFPFKARWLYWLSIVVFVLNVVMFALFLAISIIRCFLCSGRLWTSMIRNPDQQSLFLGAVPMSIGTIVIMICRVCVDAWGTPMRYVAVGLWIAEIVLAISCAFFTPFLLISSADSMALSRVTAQHLFPAVACIVASASGSVVATILPNTQHALYAILMSYVLWGIGMPMAMMILAIYYHRLLVHKLPPREVIVSVFLPIGRF